MKCIYAGSYTNYHILYIEQNTLFFRPNRHSILNTEGTLKKASQSIFSFIVAIGKYMKMTLQRTRGLLKFSFLKEEEKQY